MDVSSGQTAAPAPQASAETVTGVVEAAPAQQRAQSTPAPATAELQGESDARAGIAPAIAKLFGSSTPPQPLTLEVSYRVLHDPNQIVTVFSDPKTGQEVAQFPPDILVGIAQFFDQQSGVTLDQDA